MSRGISSRGRGGGDLNRRARGRGGPPRGSFVNNRNANWRGPRMFSNKGYRNTTNSSSNATSDGFPNSIDTWTNSTAEQVNNNSKAPPAGTTMSVGNWSDFVGTEDWSEEDWDSNVSIKMHKFHPAKSFSLLTIFLLFSVNKLRHCMLLTFVDNLGFTLFPI